MFLLQTALNDLRRRLRDPLGLLLWIAIPLAIGGVIRLAFGGQGESLSPKARVWVADLDGSLLSGALLGALSAGADSGMPLVAEELSEPEGRRRLESGDGSALLVIPKGFEAALLDREPTQLVLTRNPAQRILPAMAEETLGLLVDAVFYVQEILAEPLERIREEKSSESDLAANLRVAEIAVLVRQSIQRAQKVIDPPLLTMEEDVATEELSEPESTTGFAELFFPSMLFMALFFMAQGISEDLWVEKDQGTLRRALGAPQPVASFLAGKLLGAGLLVSAVGCLGLLAGRYLFGVQLHNFLLASVWAGFSGVLLLLMLWPLQVLASSQKTGGLITNLVMMPLMMLGGSFFPFESMPEGMASIGRLTPNGWLLTKFKDIVFDQVDATGLGIGLSLALVLGGVAFLWVCRRVHSSFGVS